ncbi:hypothetical protein C1I97_09705 [Streptomyces sp. NTH33]|nr:hypothetical protein C1I97_09705 [Streptomyces sp. NTH33]
MAHTPTDRTTILKDVTAGYEAGVFSLETAVWMLQEAGYPIDQPGHVRSRRKKEGGAGCGSAFPPSCTSEPAHHVPSA